METKTIKCVMCKEEASYIDKKTNEPLCVRCVEVNESIYRRRGQVGKYTKIQNETKQIYTI